MTAVPAMGVVAETMTALVLATEALRKFGGDSLAELVRNRDGFVASLGTTPSAPSDDRARIRERRGMTPRILLVGMMGAGKTTTGPLVAERLGWGYCDSDAEVEAATGLHGARALRRARRGGLPPGGGRRAAPRPARTPLPSVVSVAGGAVLSEDNRRLIAASGTVVWLRARPETLAAPGRRRLGTPTSRRRSGRRPGAPRHAVRAPALRRGGESWSSTSTGSPRKRSCGVSSTRWRPIPAAPPPPMERPLPGPQPVGGRSVHALSVDLADRSYPVLVGPRRAPRGRTIRPARARSWPSSSRRRRSEKPAGWTAWTLACPPSCASFPTGRSAKTLATVEELARRFARTGLSRSDVVVAVGGGIVTDVAGFAAADVPPRDGLRERRHLAAGPGRRRHRGQDRGQPARGQEPRRRVLAAERRPVRHRDPGHAPAPRVGLRPGRDGQVRLPGRRPACRTNRSDEQVARCAGIKAGGGGGRRARGRTPHDPQLRPHPGPRARERRRWRTIPSGTCATARPWPSGCVFAALLAQRLGRIDEARVDDAPQGGRQLRPPHRPSRAAPTPTELVTFMGRDKKAQQDLTFVLDGPEGVEPVRGVDERRRGRYPGGHGAGVTAVMSLVAPAVGAQPRPAG